MDLFLGHLVAETTFHTIDATPSYNMLFGRPWLHDNGPLPFTNVWNLPKMAIEELAMTHSKPILIRQSKYD